MNKSPPKQRNSFKTLLKLNIINSREKIIKKINYANKIKGSYYLDERAFSPKIFLKLKKGGIL